MSNRIYLPIYYWRGYRNYFIKLSPRHYITRYLLCSSSLPLRLKHGGSLRYFCCIYPLIPIIYWSNTPSTMIKSPILSNIYWSKSNILPSTLLRPKWHTSPLLRLPRRLYKMKRSIFNRLALIICCLNTIHVHHMRRICISTKSNLKCPHTNSHRMKRYTATRFS